MFCLLGLVVLTVLAGVAAAFAFSRRAAAIRAEAADEESLRRIQDLLAARLQKFGRREHLTVTWRPSAPAAADPEAEACTTVRSEDL